MGDGLSEGIVEYLPPVFGALALGGGDHVLAEGFQGELVFGSGGVVGGIESIDKLAHANQGEVELSFFPFVVAHEVSPSAAWIDYKVTRAGWTFLSSGEALELGERGLGSVLGK